MDLGSPNRAAAAGHEIELLNAGGGELFDRLMAERNNPQADIVFGLVDVSMALLAEEGMFQTFTPIWAEGLPEAYADPNQLVWKFWQTPIVLGINPDQISREDAPQSWLDLTRPEFAEKYVIGGLTSQTTRTYLAGMLARFVDDNGDVSDEGWDFMRAFYENGLVDVDKAQAFQSGEAYIDLNWFGGAFRFANEIGYETTLIDTDGGTPVIAEGISIMADTDNWMMPRHSSIGLAARNSCPPTRQNSVRSQHTRMPSQCLRPRSRNARRWCHHSR